MNHTHRLGYTVIHLSTHDQHAFYKHIGYQAGPAVTGARKCTAKLFVGEVSSVCSRQVIHIHW